MRGSVTALADHYTTRLCSKRIQVTEAGSSVAQVVLYSVSRKRHPSAFRDRLDDEVQRE